MNNRGSFFSGEALAPTKRINLFFIYIISWDSAFFNLFIRHLPHYSENIGFNYIMRQHCRIGSAVGTTAAKTSDSLAVKSIFALLLEEVTRPEQAHSEGRNALKK